MSPRFPLFLLVLSPLPIVRLFLFGLVWVGLGWVGLGWVGLASFRDVLSGFLRFGLAWLGLAWLDLAWLGFGYFRSGRFRFMSCCFGFEPFLFCFVSSRFVSLRCVSFLTKFGLVGFWFGSVRFGSVRFGSVRFGSVRFGSVRFGSVRFGFFFAGRREQNPAERLGERKGVGEIKRHPFLRRVHWALIANAKPPYVLSGPDSPEWAASMAAASRASRDEKMADWTWMVSCRCFLID